MSDFSSGPRSPYRRPPGDGWDGGRRTPPSRGRRSKRAALIGDRRWPRRALIVANAVVALCLIGTASAYGYVQWRLGQIHHETLKSLTGASGGKPFTMLIVGSDTRAGLTPNADNSQFGSSSQTPGHRSDTIIVARVAPATRRIELMSIPRDLWVNIPGEGMNRINAAFDTGANLLIETIQQDLGIPINHYVEVNFDTFREITDAVGGVKFYFPTPAKDAYSLLDVPHAGCVNLTGDQALGFVRSRHYEYYENGSWHFQAESDLARVQRQQAFIKKMIKKAEGEFTNPIALNNVIAGITKNLTVDSKFSTSLMITLAADFRSIDAAGIPTITLPNYPFTTSGGAEVLGLQQPQASQTIADFNNFGNTPPPSTTSPHGKAPSGVSPSSVRIEVANGTGVSGQAGRLANFLSAAGYRATATQSTPGYGHAKTEVLYAPDSRQAAQQVSARVPGGATVTESSALAPSPYNLEVVTGASYGAASIPGANPAPSVPAGPPTTTPTTVPGTNPDTYALPGMPTGETPPRC